MTASLLRRVPRPPYKVAVLVVFVIGLFVQILDATIVNVALPTIADDFGVEVTGVEWVVLGYLLTLAAGIPASGWLADRFGDRRVFLFALAVFVVASGLCGRRRRSSSSSPSACSRASAQG